MSTIARVRRMMPLNADAMTVCDIAEAGLIALAAANRKPEIVGARCMVCEERRNKNAAQMKAARVKKPAAA